MPKVEYLRESPPLPPKTAAVPGRTVLVRVLITAGILIIWFWTQSLIGARAAPAVGIDDKLHDLTAGLNAYFLLHPSAANVLLIVSSLLIDGLGIFLLARWIFGRSVRPFLGLVLLMLLRQTVQAFVLLPAPAHMIWHDPGFPSLLVTYTVANDFFFSGHSAIAVFAGIELARLKRPFITAAAALVVIFELAAVIVLRAHYTMDVVTGVLAALCVSLFVERLSTPVDRLLGQRS